MSIARAGGSRDTADTVCSTELAKAKPISGFLRPDYCAHRAQLTENDRIPALIATWRSGTRECGPAEVAGLRAVSRAVMLPGRRVSQNEQGGIWC